MVVRSLLGGGRILFLFTFICNYFLLPPYEELCHRARIELNKIVNRES